MTREIIKAARLQRFTKKNRIKIWQYKYEIRTALEMINIAYYLSKAREFFLNILKSINPALWK